MPPITCSGKTEQARSRKASTRARSRALRTDGWKPANTHHVSGRYRASVLRRKAVANAMAGSGRLLPFTAAI